jgi:uncharacterized membrane protein YebE (DUF533 family)
MLGLLILIEAAALGYTVYQNQQAAQCRADQTAALSSLGFDVNAIATKYESTAYGADVDRIVEQQLLAAEAQIQYLQLLSKYQAALNPCP